MAEGSNGVDGHSSASSASTLSKVRLDVLWESEPDGFTRPFTAVDVVYHEDYSSKFPAIAVDAGSLGRFEVSHAEWAERGLSPSIIAELPLKAIFDLADISQRIKLASGKVNFVLKRKQDYFQLIGDLRSEVKEVDQKVEKLRESVEAEFEVKGQEISKLNLQLKTLQEKAELLSVSLDSDRKKNDGEFLSIRKEILASREKEAELDQEVKDLQKGYEELKAVTAKLNTDLKSLKNDHTKATNDLKASTTSLKAELATLKGVVTDNRALHDSAVSSIRTDAKALTATVSSLSSKMDAYEKSLPQKVKGEVDVATLAYEQRFAVIKKDFDALNSSHKELSFDHTALKAVVDNTPVESIVRHGSVIALGTSEAYLASAPLHYSQLMAEYNLQQVFADPSFSWKVLWRVVASNSGEQGSLLLDETGKPAPFKLQHVRTGLFLTIMSFNEGPSGHQMLGCAETGTEFINVFGPMSIGSQVRLLAKKEDDGQALLTFTNNDQVVDDPMLTSPLKEISAIEKVELATLLTIKNILRSSDLNLPRPFLEGNYFIKEAANQELSLAIAESSGELTCAQRPFVYDKDCTSDFNWTLWWCEKPGLYTIRSASSSEPCQNKRAISITPQGVVACSPGHIDSHELMLKEASDGLFFIKAAKSNVFIRILTGVGATGKAIVSTKTEADATKFKFERKK